jgi:hypothetical protein
MSNRAPRLSNVSAPLFVRPPWMAEVQKTQERLFCLILPGQDGPVIN